MAEPESLDRLRADELHDELAIAGEERRWVREERELEREMKELEDAEVRAEKTAADELRREHWGREPERPFHRRSDDQ